MKYAYFFIFILLCLSCSENRELKYTEVYVLIDVTDKSLLDNNIIVNNIPLILGKMELDTVNVSYNGGEVKLFQINDLSESTSHSVKLKKGVPGLLGQNPMDRIEEVVRFSSDLNKMVTSTLKKVQWTREESKIYQNLCRELKILSETEASEKIVIVFSDMLENSNLISFYKSSSSLNSISDDIEQFENEILCKDCVLPDLSDISIYVVTNRNRQNDELINKSEKFWKSLFLYKNVKYFSFDAELRL